MQYPSETSWLSRSPRSESESGPDLQNGGSLISYSNHISTFPNRLRSGYEISGSRALKIRHFTGKGVCVVPERPLFTLMTVFPTLFDASNREILTLFTCSLQPEKGTPFRWSFPLYIVYYI